MFPARGAISPPHPPAAAARAESEEAQRPGWGTSRSSARGERPIAAQNSTPSAPPPPTAASPGRPGGWPQGLHVRGTSGKSHTPVLGPSTRRTPTLPWPLFSASLWLQDQLGCQCLCRARGQEGAGGPRGPGRWARSRGVGSVKASQGYLCRQSAASLLFGKLEAGGEGADPAPRKAVLHTRVAPAPPAGHPLWGQ